MAGISRNIEKIQQFIWYYSTKELFLQKVNIITTIAKEEAKETRKKTVFHTRFIL